MLHVIDVCETDSESGKSEASMKKMEAVGGGLKTEFPQPWPVMPSLQTTENNVAFPVQSDSNPSLPTPAYHLLQVGPQYSVSRNL